MKQNLLRSIGIILFVLSISIVTQCKKDEEKSAEKDILTFRIENQAAVAEIDVNTFTIKITLPENTDLTSIEPIIGISAKSKIIPGGKQDFTNSEINPLIYTVIAEDNSEQKWKVTIAKEKSVNKDILTFSVTGQTGNANIDANSHTVTCEINEGTDITVIEPSITISENATITPTGKQNFTNPVTYTVKAENGTDQAWIVSITKAQPLTNTLLSEIQNGDISGKKINDFTLASNGTDVVLLFANNSENKIYAVDIKDNNAKDLTNNTISTDINGIQANIATTLGWTNAYISNIEVNSISKAIYMLVGDDSSNPTNTAIVKLTNAGATITALDFSSIDYISMSVFSENKTVSDMTFGDNKLFVSSGSYNSDELAFFTAPFAHNGQSTNQKTSMFKSNWDNKYNTGAPLDYICYGETSNGSKRIMGITTCAPGFTLPITDLTGAGTLEVIEYFYYPGDLPKKVVSVNTGNKTFMFSLYTSKIQRIGEHFIDGSITSSTKLNENRQAMYECCPSKITTGLTDNDIKEYSAATYEIMSNYNSTHLLVLDNTDKLSLLAM